VEALSNYSVLLMLEKEEPQTFRFTLEQYRQQLMQSKEGHMLSDAGPVTLGGRLISSRFPQAYDTIAYGRGTWLLHMLRNMLLDADATGARRGKGSAEGAANDRFFTILRKVRERFEGREITTRDLQQAFEEALPASLEYDGRKSLDWFFDNWVNGTAIPQLELSQVKLAEGKKTTVATGHIVQKEVPDGFVTSVPLYAVTVSQGTVLIGRVYAEGRDSTFRLNAPAGTRRILLDPYQTVLRR
jgi:aminopeptidase N